MTLFDKTVITAPEEKEAASDASTPAAAGTTPAPTRRMPMRLERDSRLVAFERVVRTAPTREELEQRRLVNGLDQGSPVLDQLRNLAASLHQAQIDRELKVVTITSTVGGEGKTLLAANLALTLSRSYMRQVLLIDGDLRRPGLHRVFGVSPQTGVRAALDAVHHGKPVNVQEVASRLGLIPGGKPVRDPVPMFASNAMRRLISSAASSFDWVIIDTPPIGMLPDVSLVSSLSDGLLLVVEAGRVRFDLVQRSVESIGADHILGVVLNKIPETEIVATYGMRYYAPYHGKPPKGRD